MSTRFTRAEAVEHLLVDHGLKVSANYLRDLASNGKGPAYFRVGIRAFYTSESLAEWAGLKTSTTGRKASELRQKEKAAA